MPSPQARNIGEKKIQKNDKRHTINARNAGQGKETTGHMTSSESTLLRIIFEAP